MNVYARLMRVDKPVGFVLLWVPTAWALWFANHGMPPLSLLIYFVLGTLCMRSAGCVMNDLADRQIDPHVTRTCTRPLATGEVSVFSACLVLVFLLCVAGLIVLQFPIMCLYEACVGLLLSLIYPFLKRFFCAPQLMLGLAFSMGIPMAYTASGASMDTSMWLLCVLNFLWIVAYDTMYAMADREDDRLCGVHSTALLFGAYDRVILVFLQVLVHGLWLVLASLRHPSYFFYFLWFMAGGVFVYQHVLLKNRDPQDALRAFKSHAWYGVIMWIAWILTLDK